jgi:predicted CoA-binding protein/signal transduction histidine kinase
MYDFLKKIPLFADLPDSDLERICEIVDELELEAGELLFSEGSNGDTAYVIKEGQLQILKSVGEREVLLAVRNSGEVIGEMGLVEDAPRMASVRALVDTQLLAIHQTEFEELLNTSVSAARALLNTVLARWRSTEAMLRQNEKMAQLGTLTAGVAHELNNPAAAVKRSASQLQAAMAEYELAQDNVIRTNPTEEQRAALRKLAEIAHAQAARPPEMDAMARSDREYALEEWLEDHGVEDAWELAPALVDVDLKDDDLNTLKEQFTPQQIAPVAGWLSAVYRVHNLLVENGQGAGRISEIIKALKSYSYLDQAPVQQVDIHEGLDSTLVILRSKLKEGISVRRDYSSDLPEIQAYGSELNQVWTNILDNAADALIEHGTFDPDAPPEIVIHTRKEGNWVVVEIQDNGVGIPQEIVHRIFDPFFTTKPPGKGTGLGLDISYNIVANKHRGDLRVYSQPGLTTFQILLPHSFDQIGDQDGPVLSIARASDGQMQRIFEQSRTIASVGLTSRADKISNQIAAYLQSQGYRVIPVNPNAEEILGEKSYPNLAAVTEPVDVVQIFRPNEYVPGIVEQAIRIGAKAIWMQEGIINEQAAETARKAGMQVVMNACMRTVHRRLTAKKLELT